ncbi:nucleotidyltransferase family protein [Leptolyngbya sp. CCNP1308]|uniref:nucleotidyltransferase family protein n=1 Tax=Leptolyngbya sp. CCNP1308 TaxID=3110255 RepID=UPI002B1F69A9|nr:nucleotidyltransferase family protein [Leptolyngbya sp. CCNP1308]MEA5450833.1 nucleotidyltransferase family protein [Leptolyngbya sp. CCNP1308]
MPIHPKNSIDREQVLTRLKAIKPELVKQYSISKIGIFGSVARNEAHDNSDIDVVVYMQPNLLKRARLKAELEEIFGTEVDIIRYRESMNPFLKARIQQDVIYV